MKRINRIAFGIPSVDELIGSMTVQRNSQTRTQEDGSRFHDFGFEVQGVGTTSINIVGGEGSGKSILALHAATMYALESTLNGENPLVLYISSDLTYDQALKTWKDFRLHTPLSREVPFEGVKPINKDNLAIPSISDDAQLLGIESILAESHSFRADASKFCYLDSLLWTKGELPAAELQMAINHEVYLRGNPKDIPGLSFKQIRPHVENEMLEILREENPGEQRVVKVFFLDLASDNAGDDWQFIAKILGLVDYPKSQERKHLVIIDAVEGFETLSGPTDSFGADSPRRSKLTQLMQLAQGKAHLMLLNESRADNHRLDEEFICDVVLRLSRSQLTDYSYRTLEVVKARGQAIVRGHHHFTIRDGSGRSRWGSEWPDTPAVGHPYLHCFHSIDARDAKYGLDTQKSLESDRENQRRQTFFGIKYLDSMYSHYQWCKPKGVIPSSEDAQGEPGDPAIDEGDTELLGLVPGSMSLIVGQEGTYKGRVCRSFLANSFGKNQYRVLGPEETWQPIIYLTSSRIDEDGLAERIVEHLDWKLPDDSDFETLNAQKEELKRKIKTLLVLKVFDASVSTANVIAHTFEEVVMAAKRKHAAWCKKLGSVPQETPCFPRLAIDEFSTFRSIHAVLDEDKRLLTFLANMLEQENVTWVIADSQSGNPQMLQQSEQTGYLRALAKRVIYTWPITFYGEKRVAISVDVVDVPSQNGLVRELKPAPVPESGAGGERVIVDPHLELYSGVDTGEIARVGVEMVLRTSTESEAHYYHDLNSRISNDFPSARGRTRCLTVLGPYEYERLRTIANGRTENRTEHSTVLQVDEFWLHDKSDGFVDLRRYLREAVFDGPDAGRVTDPYEAFRPRQAHKYYLPENPKGKSPRRRYELFDDFEGSIQSVGRYSDFASARLGVTDYYSSRKLSYWKGHGSTNPDAPDRSFCIPYFWDFSFLLLNERMWASARFGNLSTLKPDGSNENPKYETDLVARVWNAVRGTQADVQLNSGVVGNVCNEDAPSWREFFRSCQIVARENFSSESSNSPVAFDIECLTPESLSSLVLEVWLSEVSTTVDELLELPMEQQELYVQKMWGKGPQDAAELCVKLRSFTDSISTKTARHPWGGTSKNSVVKEAKVPLLFSLPELLELFCLELFAAWLLLIEVLDVKSFVLDGDHFRHRPRNMNRMAVAGRHWYSTAAELMSEKVHVEFELGRTPGRFVTRGDWFLAVPTSSGSRRTSEKVLDQLSSLRANNERLQGGIGLPVRRIHEKQDQSGKSFVRTALMHHTSNGVELMKYDELLRFAPSAGIAVVDRPSDQRRWLWRSNLVGYYAHSRIFDKWCINILAWCGQLREKRAGNWRNGFRMYDRLVIMKEGARERCFFSLASEVASSDGVGTETRVKLARARLDVTQNRFMDTAVHYGATADELLKARNTWESSFREIEGKVLSSLQDLDPDHQFRSRVVYLREELMMATIKE